MLKLLRSALAGLMLVATQPFDARTVAAHPGGHAPMSYEEALASAALVLDDMVTHKSVDESWKGIRPIGAERVIRNHQIQWVVMLKNPAINDPAKQTLYILFDAFGEFLIANHTGEDD